MIKVEKKIVNFDAQIEYFFLHRQVYILVFIITSKFYARLRNIIEMTRE